MKKVLPAAIVAVFLACLVAPGSFSAADQPAEKPVLLKTPSCFPLGIPGVNTSLKAISENIELLSRGTMQMKIYDPGKLVPPLQVLESVSKGAVNSGFSISGYWEGTIPGASIFSSVPFGPEAPEFLAWMYYGNGRKLYQKMYDSAGYNVQVIPLGIFCPESGGWYTKPIAELGDFKGKNIRFYGLGGEVLAKLGASVSLLPGGEIFAALEKGVIDGTEFSMPAIDAAMGFHKIAKYNYFPGWHQQATIFELLINKDTWKAMSPFQQNLLETMCKAATLDTLAFTESIQASALTNSEEKNGVKIEYLNADILNALQKAWAEVATELCEKSPMFKEAWNDMAGFRKTYAIWGQNAFLPRSRSTAK